MKMKKIKEHSLYLVISEEYGRGRNAIDITSRAIVGGVDIIQMREKNKQTQDLAVLGTELLKLCRKKDVVFIVNDDPELAKEIGADGVHMGQEDIKLCSIKKVREIVGKNSLIGLSTGSLDEFKKVNDDEEVNYIAFGPIFPTTIKENYVGVSDVKGIMKIAKKPVIFIGGINVSNIQILLNEGARSVALIRGITESEDVELAVRNFKKILSGKNKIDRLGQVA